MENKTLSPFALGGSQRASQPLPLARRRTEMHAQAHHHQGLCESSLLFITQGPRVPEGDSSPVQSVAALRRPVLTTTFLLERGEPYQVLAPREPKAGIGTLAVHNVHLFGVLTQNDKSLQIHAEKKLSLANY